MLSTIYPLLKGVLKDPSRCGDLFGLDNLFAENTKKHVVQSLLERTHRLEQSQPANTPYDLANVIGS